MKSKICALFLIVASGSALAASTSGNAALSLAALVGLEAPHMTKAEHDALRAYLNGRATPKYAPGKFTVKADAVTCRISNVDITEQSCELTFGTKKISFKGRKAHELYATLVQNGVPSDGAAGSMFESVTNLACAIDPAEIASRGGGGAGCDFTPSH
jgi:hypothetical protein